MHLKKLEIVNCLNIAACVCGKDGVISNAEEKKMFQMLSDKFPEFLTVDFESALDDFFDSEEQFEDYLSKISDHDARVFTLKLSEASAREDGLDIRENIALQKAHQIWGIAFP